MAIDVTWAAKVFYPGDTSIDETTPGFGDIGPPVPDALLTQLQDDTGDVWRLWAGEGRITIAGETYYGTGGLINLSAAEIPLGQQAARLRVEIAITEEMQISDLLVDPGPIVVEILFLRRLPNTIDWEELPRKFVGRLSRPQIQDNVYTMELETDRGDVDRGRTIFWSQEGQRWVRAQPDHIAADRTPDAAFSDDFLVHMRRLAAGIETRWPT